MKEKRRRASILIVEDEAATSELLRRTLRSDARVLLAASVEEARAILETTEIDVVVTDHRLADATGVSLLHYVAETHPTLGRILITAYGDSKEVIQACDSGIVERFS